MLKVEDSFSLRAVCFTSEVIRHDPWLSDWQSSEDCPTYSLTLSHVNISTAIISVFRLNSDLFYICCIGYLPLCRQKKFASKKRLLLPPFYCRHHFAAKSLPPNFCRPRQCCRLPSKVCRLPFLLAPKTMATAHACC